MTRPLDLLRQRLRVTVGEPRHSGNGWLARCPAHDDQNPSLSIGEGNDGRVLLHCFAGCAPDDILSALDLSWADLSAVNSSHKLSSTQETATSRVVTYYEYRRADGTLIKRKVRLEPKNFYQEAWDAANQQWKRSLSELSPRDRYLPYHLPELQMALQRFPNSRVFIVEGEKDVETLERLGAIATTAGSARDWRDETARQLIEAGARAFTIIADRDEPGKEYAREVSKSLHKVAREQDVEIDIGPPLRARCEHEHEPRQCKDISDIVERHGAADVGEALEFFTELEEALWAATARSQTMAASQTPLPDLAKFGILGEWATAVASYVQVSPEMAFAACLGVAAIPCGLGASVQRDNVSREPAILQLLIVANPSERKSSLLKLIDEGLRHGETALKSRRDDEINQARAHKRLLEQQLKKAKRSSSRKTPLASNPEQNTATSSKASDAILPGEESVDDVVARLTQQLASHVIPERFRVFTDSATSEAIEAVAHKHQGRIAFLTDEAGNTFDTFSRYNKTNVPNFTPLIKGYDAGRYIVDRITRELVDIAELRIPMLAMLQPESWQRLSSDPRAVGSGLISRLLIVAPPSRVGTRIGSPPEPDQAIRERWTSLLSSLLVQAYDGGTQVFTLTPKARSLWQQLADDLEIGQASQGRFDTNVLQGWAGKHAARALRLAAVLQAVFSGRLGGVIDDNTMDLAIQCARWFEGLALELLGGFGEPKLSPDAKKLLKWGSSKEPFTARDAIRSLHGWNRHRFMQAIGELEQYGLAEAKGTGSRPNLWQVHNQ